jgi:hypothetical protein
MIELSVSPGNMLHERHNLGIAAVPAARDCCATTAPRGFLARSRSVAPGHIRGGKDLGGGRCKLVNAST